MVRNECARTTNVTTFARTSIIALSKSDTSTMAYGAGNPPTFSVRIPSRHTLASMVAATNNPPATESAETHRLSALGRMIRSNTPVIIGMTIGIASKL